MVEMRAYIELKDLEGVEFECNNCKSKIFYSLGEPVRRVAHQCPSCNEALLFVDPNIHPSVPRPYDDVKQLLERLRILASTPSVAAFVRLRVSGAFK